jgi:hypothetical protein
VTTPQRRTSTLVQMPLRRVPHPGETEVTRFYPREGRAAPAHLRAVPEPPAEERTVYARSSGRVTWKDILQLRGELPAPRAAKKSATLTHVPPYLRKGYRWDLLGEDLHDHMRWESGKAAAIRPCPPTLARLLATPEWSGSAVSEPTPMDIASLKASVERTSSAAWAAVAAATGKANKARATAHAERHAARLERLHEARRIAHPSGAVILWLPL